MDEQRLIAVLTALENHSVRYVVFGGIALNLHGLVRATEDIDIFIAADAQNVDALKAALHSVFAEHQSSPHQSAAGRLVRLRTAVDRQLI